MEWMKLLNVSHLRDIAFQHVSSGEQRLLLFARAMVKRPELLILDEPMHGLDIVNKRRIKRFIESYCSEHITLIYVTHYRDELPDIIDKQLVLKKSNSEIILLYGKIIRNLVSPSSVVKREKVQLCLCSTSRIKIRPNP
jgi:ABC-type molybdenum transport system, ATPase component/photorepair protein PhrA